MLPAAPVRKRKRHNREYAIGALCQEWHQHSRPKAVLQSESESATATTE